MSDSDTYTAGLAVRRAVVGETYVDDAMAQADDFSLPLQRFVTEAAWGTVWVRDGLPRSTRSLVTVALLCALNRPAELRTHIRGALRNGCTSAEIREVLLHVGVYAGVPAAVDGFGQARTAFEAHREAGETVR